MRKASVSRRLHGVPRILLAPVVFFESCFFVVRLARLVRTMGIDVVHSHMFSANLWGRLAVMSGGRAKVITTEHTSRTEERSMKRLFLNRILARFSNRVVAVSGDVARAVIEQQGLPPEKVLVIPNALKIARPSSSADSVAHEGALPGKRPRIASIGRLVTVKRHDVLLRALKIALERIPELTCWIIGDGPEKVRIEEMARDMDILGSVSFLGERRDVRELLRFIDVVVNTSDREGMPVSLLEAMAERVPVVASDVGGVSEIVQTGKTGILVPPGDPERVAKGICTLIESPELREHIRDEAFRLVSVSYSIDTAARLWEKLYEEI